MAAVPVLAGVRVILVGEPVQITSGLGAAVTTATGLTVTTISKSSPSQLPLLGVTV
jgi:hypothetical protein